MSSYVGPTIKELRIDDSYGSTQFFSFLESSPKKEGQNDFKTDSTRSWSSMILNVVSLSKILSIKIIVAKVIVVSIAYDGRVYQINSLTNIWCSPATVRHFIQSCQIKWILFFSSDFSFVQSEHEMATSAMSDAPFHFRDFIRLRRNMSTSWYNPRAYFGADATVWKKRQRKSTCTTGDNLDAMGLFKNEDIYKCVKNFTTASRLNIVANAWLHE